MSAPSTSSQAPAAAATGAEAAAVEAVDASCRVSLLVLFLAAAGWAVLASALSLAASIKFHSPVFLSGCAWLTYGRIQPAGIIALVYGFGMQAGLGVGLWLLARLGRAALEWPLVVIGGAVFWNIGVAAGLFGVLAGDSTGFRLLEMPVYAGGFLFAGYLLIGIPAALLFHLRRAGRSYVSQWFILAALLWFPWIYSTAELLLNVFPVRGVVQSIIAWWYGENLLAVWFGLLGLAGLFYFMPKLSGRDLHSYYLALLTFWLLLLAGSWACVPRVAPVPAWMPAISTVATVLMLVPTVAVALNISGTLGLGKNTAHGGPSLGFVAGGGLAFLVYWLMRVVEVWPYSAGLLQFTWFTVALRQLYLLGFCGLILLGGIYYILPRIAGERFFRRRLVRAHLIVALLGVVLIFVPLTFAGLSESTKLADPATPFAAVFRSTLLFLRFSTIGELLILVGNVLLLGNVAGLIIGRYRAQAAAAYAAATALNEAGVKP
jgi:cytochrome c oxidase cbb3-type subunit I